MKLPVSAIKVIAWDRVFRQLELGEEPTYKCTPAEARMFTQWTRRHKQMPVYYRTAKEGHLTFSLEPQRANAGTTRSKKGASA